MKLKQSAVFFLMAAAAALSASAQEQVRRATMRDIGGSWGKCTIEVEVDDVAEVMIAGDTGRIRTLAGSPAFFRRFECSGAIPAQPADFRFRGIDGRGRVDLVRDPRDNRGVAIVRIDDSKGGREGYTFDLEWRGGGPAGGFGGGRGDWGRGDRGGYDRGGYDNDLTGTVRNCEAAVQDRLLRDGYRNVKFRSTSANDRPGRNDRILGSVSARGGGRGNDDFDYTCSVDMRNGRIRDVDLRRR